jgi:soluble lytic murein transglycosylase-like protein
VKRILMMTFVVATIMLSSGACVSSSSPAAAIRRNFPAAQYAKAMAVARCESGLNPRAISPGGANWGLFQINRVHEGMVRQMGYRWNQMLDANVNAKVARVLYNQSGWRPWSCA